MKTRCIRYEGKVQGVGFRATVVALAREYDITGSVKNLTDGRVELIVCGDPEEVELFLVAIRESHLAGHIKQEEEVVMEPKLLPPLKGFSILYSS